ncbi:MAG: T9SS type A sorting domain-containing protein [Rhodothermales bacterium]
MKKLVTHSPNRTRWRKPFASGNTAPDNIALIDTDMKSTSIKDAGTNWFIKLASFVLFASVLFPQLAKAQSAGAFIEDNGLVVMEVESVERPFNWKFETIEEGFTGDGYLRYIGANHFNEPGFDILEFDVVITNPGEYKMFLWSSHIDAPEPDQNNDAWTKMDDGEWTKTVHPGVRQEEGFTFHTQWVTFVDGVETFSEPTYQLDAGVHTFYISGRSWSFRMDRVHIWKNDAPFKVSYDVASMNTHPESARDNTILTVAPDPVTFTPTPIGLTSQITASLNNEGDEVINITGVSISGDDAGDFSTNFSGALSVPANGSADLGVILSPGSNGTKVATMAITHDGLNSPTNVNLFGTGTSGGSGTTVLFRVNSGGPLIADPAGDWLEDQTAVAGHNNGTTVLGTPHPFVNSVANGDWAFGRSDEITLDFSVPPGTPAALFNDGRWDPINLPTQQWDIPVDAGTEVEVRLYFAEQLFEGENIPADQGWPRIFDVEIDGVIYAPLDDLHIFEEAGHDVGIMRSVVLISDGIIDIDLLNISHDPIIQAIEILEVGSISRAMDEGWNLVGLPTDPADKSYTSVFDNLSLISDLYQWDGGTYNVTSSLQSGVGYWLKTSAAGNQSFNDEVVNTVTSTLQEGWNMISGPACVVAWDNISDPGNVLIDETLYAYSNGYVLGTALLPGSGYWVQATGAGTITLDCGVAGKVSRIAKNNTTDLDRFGMINVRDRAGMSQDLYFGSELDESVDARRYAMPPKGQAGDFDVRFSTHTRLDEGDEQFVRLQSSDYPLVVKLDRKPDTFFGAVVVEEILKNGEVVKSHDLQGSDSITISNEDVIALRIKSADTFVEALPETFTLEGNYPNPFNPSTQVVFNMPEAGVVKVEVFDLLGRNVMSVPAQDFAAGVGRQIQIDGSSLASGTYLYHLTVEMASQSVTQVGRMTMIK